MDAQLTLLSVKGSWDQSKFQRFDHGGDRLRRVSSVSFIKGASIRSHNPLLELGDIASCEITLFVATWSPLFLFRH